MKHLFLSLILLAGLGVSTPATATKTSVTTNGDTTIIVDEKGDSAVIKSKIVGLTEKLVSSKILDHLDDTLLDATSDNIKDYTDTKAFYDQKENDGKRFVEINKTWAATIRTTIKTLCVFLLILIAIVLFFRYLNRVRKYDVMKKAIDNNYQLPDGVFGNTTKVVYTSPQPVAPIVGAPMQGTPIPPAFNPNKENVAQGQPVQGQPAQATPPTMGQINFANQVNWRSIKGFPAVAVGIAGMLFFLFAGAYPVAALCLIPLLIGLGQVFTSYVDQRNAIIAGHYYAQQPVQGQPVQQPVQGQPVQQPVQGQPVQQPVQGQPVQEPQPAQQPTQPEQSSSNGEVQI